MGLSAAERNAPQSKHIRYTFSQDKRIEEACAYLGCTIQSFVLEATLERLAKVEAEMRADKDRREQSKKEPSRHRAVRGLGLRSGRIEAAREVEVPQAAPAPQVVVNVPAAAPAAGDVPMLAAFVAKGSILGRGSRLERAREVLAAALDGDVLEAAKKSLDAAVAVLAPKTSTLDWFRK